MKSSKELRLFNNKGIREFSVLLQRTDNSDSKEFLDLCSNPELTEIIEASSDVEIKVFNSKLSLAEYLFRIIDPLEGLQEKFYNPGLWGWLSSLYIESICPIIKNTRRTGSISRYIFPDNRDYKRYYRHLIAFPVILFASHKADKSLLRMILYGPPHIQGDFIEQIASRQDFIRNRGILEAANILYWDKEDNIPQKGARGKKGKSGSLRRFISVLHQLELTYDLIGMSGEQIIRLLPQKEFSIWMD